MATPFTPEDLFHLQRIDSVHVLPDGKDAVCSVRQIQREQDTYTGAIWVLPLNGNTPWQLTAGTALDNEAHWSPDGQQIAFLSDRADGFPQIHLIPRHGGEARQLSRFTQGAIMLAWSPQGDRLACTCVVKVDPKARGGRDGVGQAPSGPAPQVVWRLPYKRDGVGYTLDQEIHLFVIDANTGDNVQLTDGSFEVKGLCWSPDGQRLAYVRTREGRFAHRTDLWCVDADGSNHRQLTSDQANSSVPAWSPDGRWIAFVGNTEEGDAQMRLWLIDMHSGQVRPLGDESLEIVPEGNGPLWSEDSQSLTLLLARRGVQEVARVAVPGGETTTVVTGERHVNAVACTRDTVVFVAESPSQAPEVYACDPSGANERRLSRFNAWWDERPVPTTRLRTFDVPDGRGGTEQVDGWLVTPPDAQGPMPLLVDVHGGPASYAFLTYNAHAYWQVLSSRGWAVVALNAVGSSSYGREFASRLRGHWGEMDLPQHVAAVKALRDEGLADDRVAIAGKSYGGYLSAWAIGQTSAFRAAIVSAPVGNLETHYGTSDSGYYADPYSMCGEPFIDRQASQRLSPVKHVEKARTPTLFLQGAEDERCPKCQSEEMFTTMMRATDTPCEMVIYPGGSHHFFEDGTPSHRLDMLQRLVEWLARWIDTPIQQQQDARRGSRSDGH